MIPRNQGTTGALEFYMAHGIPKPLSQTRSNCDLEALKGDDVSLRLVVILGFLRP